MSDSHYSTQSPQKSSLSYNSLTPSPGQNSIQSPDDNPGLFPSLGTVAESSSARGKAQELDDLGIRYAQVYKRLRTASGLLSDKRIAQCQRHTAPVQKADGSWGMPDWANMDRDPANNTGHFTNLIRCESYSCPHCAIKRCLDDVHQMRVLIAEAQKRGHAPVFVTLTLSHHIGDKLDELRSLLGEAFNRLFSGRFYEFVSEEFLVAGKLKSYETMCGENGWHPHIHALVFVDKTRLDGISDQWLESLTNHLRRKWIDILKRLGAFATYAHGCDVRIGDSAAAEYLAKFGREAAAGAGWGVEDELGRAPAKSGRLDSLTPFQLLDAAGGDEEPLRRVAKWYNLPTEQAQQKAGELYREYFEAFYGVARLHWGKNLREVYNLPEALRLYAEQNPPKPSEKYSMVLIPSEQIHKIMPGRYEDGTTRPDRRAQLRGVVGSGDVSMLLNFLASCGIEGAVITELAYEKDPLLWMPDIEF